MCSLAIMASRTAHSQEIGMMTDPRDGQVYETFSYENEILGTTVTWMAQNLNYKMEGSYSAETSGELKKYAGLFYSWYVSREACPDGWHLPLISDWEMLIDQFGGQLEVGAVFKSSVGWYDNGNGDNSSGFNAFPIGKKLIGKTSIHRLTKEAYFWCSAQTDRSYDKHAVSYYLGYSSKTINRSVHNNDLSFAMTCRCVKD